MGADNKDIEVLLEVLGITVARNVVILLDIKKRVTMTEDVTELVTFDLLAVGTVAVVKTGFIVCWKVAVSNEAGVVIVVVAACNSGVGKMIPDVGDTVVLMGETIEVLEASTLTEVFAVSNLGNIFLVNEDVETIGESAIAVISFFAFVIMVPKLVAAVVDVVIRVVEDVTVVDLPVGESFKIVEERIGIRMVLIAVGFVAVVVVWAAIVGTPVVITDNCGIEVILEVVCIFLATNVVISTGITERFVSAENTLEVFGVDELAVRTNSVLMVESAVCWGVVVSAGASGANGVALVACNVSAGEFNIFVDNVTILTGASVLVCETTNEIEVSVILSFEKDVFVTDKTGIVDGLNAVVAAFVVPLVIVFEVVATVDDGVTPVVEGVVVADFAVAELLKAEVESFTITLDLIAVRPTDIVVSGAILVTLVVVGCKDIEGVLELVGITVATNVVIPLFITEMDKFEEDIIEVVRPNLIAVETVFVVRVAIMGRWKVFVNTEAYVVMDIAIASGSGGVGEII